MKVYRVENDEFIGPYTGDVDGMGGLRERQPLPDYDFAVPPGEEYLYAFTTMTQLLDWFTEDQLHILEVWEFNVVQITVPTAHVRVGGKQCAFVGEHAGQRRVIPWVHVWNAAWSAEGMGQDAS